MLSTYLSRLLAILTLLLPLPLIALTPQYRLAICSVFQNEARFLKEWIEFHRLVGVDHFFLYNHYSDDDYTSVLKDYIEEGIVDLFHLEPKASNLPQWLSAQCKAYNHAVRHFKNQTQWIAFIDADEYLVPVSRNTLPALLQNYANYGGLSVQWQLFGTSGVEKIPPDRLLIETLTRQADPEYWEHANIKVIAQPQHIKKFHDHPALPEYREPYVQVNSEYIITHGPLCHHINIDDIRINHYWTGDSLHLSSVKWPRWTRWHHPGDLEKRISHLDEVEDTTILRFAPMLRLRMGLEMTAGIALRIDSRTGTTE